MYIQVHWVLKWYTHVFTFYVHVQKVYIHVYAFSYLLFTCFNMSILCIYKSKDIHTWYIQVQTCIYSFSTWTNDLMHTSKLSWPLCYQRACNKLTICCISKLFTWRLVTHVWRWTRSAPQPGHDVSSASTRIALKPRPPGVRSRATRRPHWQCCRADDSARRQVD